MAGPRNALKLEVEYVPPRQHRKNLRAAIGQYRWKKLADRIRRDAGNRCSICGQDKGTPGWLQADEEWQFIMRTRTQQLVGIRAICRMCHLSKHPGVAAALARERGYPSLISDLKEHFMRVNACDCEAYERAQRNGRLLMIKRDQVEWKLDFGEYASHIPVEGANG